MHAGPDPAGGREAVRGHGIPLPELRRRVAELDRADRARADVAPFGIESLDAHLPWRGLPLGCLHEFVEAGVESEHVAAATLFVAGILARLEGVVLWCLRGRDLFAPALAGAGLHPDRVIYVETRRDAEVLPAMEEGLRHGGLAGVVGEAGRLPLAPSRRLQLAAEASGVPALVIRRWRDDSERASAGDPSAVFTRWRVSAAPSPAPQLALQPRAPLAQGPPEQAPPLIGLSRARWHVELLRCRGAEARSFLLEACDAEGRLALPADIRDRPDPAARPRRRGDGRSANEGSRRSVAAA